MPGKNSSEMPSLGKPSDSKKPEDLDVPLNDEEVPEKKDPVESEKPKIIKPGKADNEVKLPSVSKGILVVAQRKGFYNQQRLNPGAKFTIRGEKQFATWFTCVDPLLEEKRKKFIKDKKAKR